MAALEKSKSISFLFGAGCEGKGQIGLPSGEDFKKDTLLSKDVKSLIYSLNKQENNIIKIDGSSILSPHATSVLYQTIVESKENDFSFEEKDQKTVSNYIKIKNRQSKLSKSDQEKVRNDFREIYYKQFYRCLMGVSKPKNEKNIKNFLNKGCFFSYVDSLFNYLRKPNNYQKEVSKVVKLYYSAYKSIIDGIGKIHNPPIDLFKILHIKNKRKCNYDNETILENRIILQQQLKQLQNSIVETKNNAVNSCLYYQVIRDFIDQTKNEIQYSAVTANYTSFAEQIIGIKNIAYVHGKLEWFEDVKTKKVGELADFKPSDFIMPFLFIQSGVKPIVASKQIYEMAKAAKSILEADLLIILGYGINSDDEHISNLLRERLNDKKRTFCFVFNKNYSKEKKIRDELFCQDNCLVLYDCTEFEKVLKSIKL